MVALDQAYAACERLAASHYENFPVASVLLPRRMRRHVAAVYAFARAADDFADEGRHAPAVRYARLDRWGLRLRAAAAGDPQPAAGDGEPCEAADVFRALGATIRECGLPVPLFEDLLSAFRQDVGVTRYETWTDLFDYCRRSANPVGRLVLRIAGAGGDVDDEARADAFCTALQLTNFWQDLKDDFARGRIYLPAEEYRARGAREEDLARRRLTPEWRLSLAAAAARTRTLFETGRPLCDRLRGRLRLELRATWLGGVLILDRLAGAGFDPLVRRPRLRRSDAAWLAWKLVAWS